MYEKNNYGKKMVHIQKDNISEMVSKKLSVALFISICFLSCRKKTETTETKNIPVDSVAQTLLPSQDKEAREVAKTVERDSISGDTIHFTVEENLYGTFFGDRAEFFIVNEPESLIHGAKIKTVTFCYLDGELCKSKYVLASDISNKLIRTYGSFKIKGFDFKNRHVIQVEPVMMDYGKGQELNLNLHNFELTWILGDRHIKMRVNRYMADRPFEYTEQLADYNLLFKSAEYGNP